MAELVDIKDISGNIRFSTTINEGSKRHFLLMQEDYITLLFSLSNPVYFKLGDYVDNELGIFELVDLYKPTYNTTTGAYDYELRLDAYYWKWKNKKFFYTPETTGREAAWNLTATLDTHLNVFLDNLNALGYKFREEEFTYEIDSTVENTSKLISYDNVNLIDALTQMAETWECEWWITEHVIHFGRCEYSSPVDFKAGDLTDTENVNVNSMTRSDSQTTYATRIYAFGSTRNIPSSYRKELIFDVKEVNGRNISDTSRPLKISYFPSRVTYKEDYTASSNEGSGSFTPSYTEWTLDKTLASSAKGGSYKVVSGGISINISTAVPQIGNRAFLPAGDYILKASYIYNVSGESKEVIIGNQTVSLAQNQQYEIVSKIQVPDTLVIDKNSSDLKVRVYVHVPAPASSELLSTFQAYVTYDINVYGGSSATTSVTFLSGANAGQTFAAVYNPDLLTGDAANIIQLPEGVTASLGNRYTINNIISGKVPDNYFSKDDKEMTLNGVVQKRLMLPEGISYVDAYKYSPTGERINIGDERYNDPDNVEMPEEEAIEEIVIFEDEYPQYKGTISSVSHDDKVDDNDKEYRIYNFKDTGLKNFTEDFRLDGEELHMIFQTGKLAGMDFAINIVESDNTGTTFEIVRNEDYGRFLPDDVLYPQTAHMEDGEEVPADTYILYGFDTAYISEQMLPDAEQDLLKKAKEYVKKSMIDPSTYDCEMDADFIYNKGNIRTYEVGAKVNLINKAFFPEGRQSRIIGFEWPLDIPYDHPIYTVGETASYSRIGEIESKLDSLTYKGQTYFGSAVGGGGISVYVIGVNDKTIPSDRNVFSAKRVLQEIIAYAISKTKDDTALGLISFLNGINVTKGVVTDTITATELSSNIVKVLDKLTANNAAFSGNISSVDYAEKLLGWLITPSGDIDAKSLRLRDFLEVPELRYNRVSVITGEEWNAPGGGIIESVDEENSIVYLKLEPGEVAAVEVDDICKANFNNDTGFQTTYFRITEKLDNGSFKYVLRSGYTYHPQKAMHFVCYGNFTNAERQKSSYSTQNYIRFLKGVNNWEITKDMIAMQLGDLSNLKLFGMDMTGHSAYLNRIYMTGTIKQISNDGVTEVPVPAFKGEWKAGTYWYYDEVTHNGSTWICIESTTTQEPSDSSTDWLKVISKGEDGASGKGVKSIVEQYYLSTSQTSLTGGSWNTTPPTWQDGKYIWTRVVITYTNNTYTETDPVCVTGGKGPSGNDGVGISAVDVLFYLSTSSSSLEGGAWSTTSPAWEDGKYLWTKTKVTYTNGSTWESDPACITGSQGKTGLPGAMLRPRGVWKANTEYYRNETFIDTVIYNGQNKLCKITHTSTSSFDSTKWEEFSEFENVATNVLLAQNATIDVLGSSGIFVGNLEKTKGWIMTEGSIKHNVTGVELTSDGKISLPETGGINVGGKTFIEAGKIKTEFIDVDNLTVKKLAAVEGTIAGFKISDTHIGVDDPNHNNAYEGLSLYKDFIKFSDEKSWAGIGTNVFPLSSGMSCLGRFDFTSSEVDSGTAVYAKFRPAVDDLGWSQQTAIQYDGNIYGIGQRAIFEDGYIGQAYTDVLTTFIKRTHNFVFNGQSVVNLGMVLPGKRNLGINNDVSFLLSIVITWNPTTAHRITLKGSSDGRLLNNAGEVLSPELDSNGAISLGRGNTLLLRYCSSHYYIVSYRYQ
ncbi:hypothetical protein [Bacteroides ovatus]|uniref:hypothetical protein n=1 Tax=Bacteroides ovatus TaxID=28116 RepID=UPI002166AB88|nr:hypothetical protein [Bacteroides ovatus]MCS2300934.1 hypothetical protein [Bacteroides ovatus]